MQMNKRPCSFVSGHRPRIPHDCWTTYAWQFQNQKYLNGDTSEKTCIHLGDGCLNGMLCTRLDSGHREPIVTGLLIGAKKKV